jgi:hypothetical protein
MGAVDTAPRPASADVPVARTIKPPPPPSPPLPVDYDGRFISNMSAKGWTILDPALFIQRAHRTCELLRQGTPREQIGVELLKVEPMLNIYMVRQFTAVAQDTYPNCP